MRPIHCITLQEGRGAEAAADGQRRDEKDDAAHAGRTSADEHGKRYSGEEDCSQPIVVSLMINDKLIRTGHMGVAVLKCCSKNYSRAILILFMGQA